VHVPLWLLAVGFVWAGGFIASRVTRAVVWAPLLAGATALTLNELLSGYADVPLAYYLGLGTLQLGVWLESERPADLGVATLLLAGAASIKNEGTSGAVLVLVVGLALTVARRRRAARQVAVALAVLVVVAVLPWRIWVAAHHLQTEEPLGRTVDPAFLVNHIGRVGPSLRALAMQLEHPAGVTVFVAVALAIAGVCLAERQARALAGFYLVAGLGYVVLLVWAYWISTLPLGSDLAHSTDRVVVVPAFIAVAAVMHLSGSEPDLPPGRGPPAPAP
jgi:hypothetical protein